MIILSLNTDMLSCDNRCNTIVYNLLASGEQFEIECYTAGANDTDSKDYCKVTEIMQPQEKLERLLHLLANRHVTPVHIPDIISDYFS